MSEFSKMQGDAPTSGVISVAVGLYRDAVSQGKTPMRWEMNHPAHHDILPHMFDRSTEIAAVFSLPIRVDHELGSEEPVVHLWCREP